MDQPLTVVLPMHNCERQLRSSVLDILELTAAMRRPLQIVVVDDGSTDETYETACELSRQYPQLIVLRQSLRQGLGAALEMVRNRLAVEKVVAHDGMSAIDAAQLQSVLQMDEAEENTFESGGSPNPSATQSCGSRRFAAVRALHNRMEQAHMSSTCFRWMQLEKPLVPRRRAKADVLAPTMDVVSHGAQVPLVNLPAGINPVVQR